MSKAEDKKVLVEDLPNGSAKTGCKCCKGPISELNIIHLSVVILTIAITIALILCVFFGPSQVTPHGAVISVSNYCSKAGELVLQVDKGNAVDAAVSTILCLAVTRPDVASLGGCGAFFVHDHESHNHTLYDAMCTAPSNLSTVVNLSDPKTQIGVPGVVAGLRLMHAEYGRLPWSRLFSGAMDAATHGFEVHRDLVRAAVAAAKANPAVNNAVYHTLSKLKPGVKASANPDMAATLMELAEGENATFYVGDLAQKMSTFLSWKLVEDLASYSVVRPTARSMGFAGFNILTFPAPFTGGLIAASALGNLDLINNIRPLSASKLFSGDTAETAILYHRLVELFKFASAEATFLGDPSDQLVGAQVTEAENRMFSSENRKAIVGQVKDTMILSKYGKMAAPTPDLIDVGDTFVAVSDPGNLFVGVSLVMGAPFGSGLTVPGTGVLMNAAVKLFTTASVGTMGLLNVLAPGRRPLVPVSPVFLETARKRCGHRLIVAEQGGYVGIMGVSQVILDALLYLSSVNCTPTKSAQPKDLQPASPPQQSSTTTYTPAVDACIPLVNAMKLKRFMPVLLSSNATDAIYQLKLEHGFPVKIKTALERLGQKTSLSSAFPEWQGQLGSVGLTNYVMEAAVDPRMPNSLAAF